MMMALFKANPEAFNRNDMDSLKAGVILKIPETAAILKSFPNQAHNKQKPVRKVPTANGKPLELLPPSESVVANPQSGAGQEAKGTDAKELELQAKIDNLEKQMGMLQQMLALKDQQLANLQNTGTTPAIQTKPTDNNQTKPAETKPAETAQTKPAEAKPAETAQTKPAEAKPAETAQTKPSESKPVETAQTKPAVTLPKPPPTPVVAPPAPDEGLFSLDPLYLSMGGIGVGILSLFGWLFWRKRKIDELTNTESMFRGASQISMPDTEGISVPVLDLDSSANYDVGTVGESSFISDFTPSDFGGEFDTDQNEIDPLSEADVYLAYARYQQAEELIRAALLQDPDKDTFKLKLLEIFYAAENKNGFAGYARRLLQQVNKMIGYSGAKSRKWLKKLFRILHCSAGRISLISSATKSSSTR